MVQPLLDASSIQKNDYQVAVLALILSPRTVPNMSVHEPDYHFQEQWLGVESIRTKSPWTKPLEKIPIG